MQECDKCHGTGLIKNETKVCGECRGRGVMEAYETLVLEELASAPVEQITDADEDAASEPEIETEQKSGFIRKWLS